MTSIDVLRQEAITLGITEEEAKKYGNLRHRRTWSLAIEHHQAIQNFAHPPESQEVAMSNTPETEGLPTDSPRPPLESSTLTQRKTSNSVQQSQGFQQVVRKHIKALKASINESINQDHILIDNWICPECKGKIENCYLCEGTGSIDDLEAKGWTLAYMELLGCSPKEIEPLREDSSHPLEINFIVCSAIKNTKEILKRTEKWVKV